MKLVEQIVWVAFRAAAEIASELRPPRTYGYDPAYAADGMLEEFRERREATQRQSEETKGENHG
jgi:hypothetical protein